MISPDLFDEFIAPYYRELIPFLKERGAGEIFLDTDGDFTLMIPNLMACGIDGVLPVDVNAGVDIVKVRQAYPNLKFWGGFNKLAIIQGPEAIEAEFRRLEPVIRQGGCIICTDHQAAPQTPLAHYRYYLQRLREVMCEMRGEKAARRCKPAPSVKRHTCEGEQNTTVKAIQQYKFTKEGYFHFR